MSIDHGRGLKSNILRNGVFIGWAVTFLTFAGGIAFAIATDWRFAP